MKYIKIKTGDVYINGRNVPVFQTAWERVSKNGITYYEIVSPVFIQEKATVMEAVVSDSNKEVKENELVQ